jgi:predicted MFS family arabinose efflux permease
MSSGVASTQTDLKSHALKFVVLVGILSFFADFTYEGSRSIVGPYLAVLGASAAAISIITGLGEFLGYGLRLVSGRAADTSQKFWPIAIFGYIVQMSSVPLLAFVHRWQTAAILIILERIGKAIRNPPRDVMLSHAGHQIGRGWAFGLHEALDQFGALFGPLLVALVLAAQKKYESAFLVLAIPAGVCILFLFVARWIYPRPEAMEEKPPAKGSKGLSSLFWLYLVAAGLVAAGFVDYPLLAYHLQTKTNVSKDLIPVFYAVAMGVSGVGSLVLGRIYDRLGFSVLILLTAATAWFAPLIFFGNFWLALCGAALWGLGMGVHESLIPAAVAPMVPGDRRASAYGLFTTGYGFSWFLGSIAIGFLYQYSLLAVTLFCIILELAAIPVLVLVNRRATSKL